MQPTPSEVHTDAALTNVSVAYRQGADAYIANRVFPTISVSKQTDKYFKYDKGDWFRDEAQKRAPATESVGDGYDLSTDTYSADVFALHVDVPDQVIQNADNPLTPESDAARLVMQRMLLRQEIQWATDYFATGIWDVDKTGGTDFTKWDNYATSTPLEDIETQREAMLKLTGFLPNTLVVGYPVFSDLKNHPEFVDRIKHTSSEVITSAIMARLFEVDNFFVCRAVKETAVEGETSSFDFVHGKQALLCYSTPTPGLLVPSAGYTFEWSGISDGIGETVGTTRILQPLKRSVRIESQLAWDFKVVATDLGTFFTAVVA